MAERSALRDWIHPVDGSRRYVPDCPLPPYAFAPGAATHPHPHRHEQGQFRNLDWSTARLPPEDWPRHRPYLIGIDWHNYGFYWEAHEVWEACWQANRGHAAQAHHFLSLIQVSIACLHQRRGSSRAVVERLLDHSRRHREALMALVGDSFMGLDLVALGQASEAFRRSGIPPRLRPQLGV